MSNSDTPTVLLVDDESALADGHAARLDGYDIRTAYDGDEALDALDSDVDVVFLDRRMPGLSGDEVLERIRSRNIECRVVMLTGVEPAVDIVEMGFDEYLQKPITRAELRTTIERMYRRTAYDSRLRQYFSLASKRATLETRHSRSELEGTPEYERLLERLSSVKSELDDVLEDLPEEDGYLIAADDPRNARADG